MAAVALDATDPEAPSPAPPPGHRRPRGLDVVVWCAGYWQQFDAAAWDREAFARHVEVNLLGLNNVLAAVVPAMVAARRGHIVGIASVAGYRGLAGAEAYGATKAAQINLLEALRASLSRTGIRVTTVCPGLRAHRDDRVATPSRCRSSSTPTRPPAPSPTGSSAGGPRSSSRCRWPAHEGRPLVPVRPLVEVRGTRMTSTSPETPPLR